jgi:hypothetical protein
MKYNKIDVDEFGKKGKWKMIYKKGLEIKVKKRNLFEF